MPKRITFYVDVYKEGYIGKNKETLVKKLYS